MSTHEELAALIDKHSFQAPSYSSDAASAVIAEGWRPPPRVVEGHDDLQNLPSGSVVLHTPCSDVTHACLWTKGAFQWFTVGTTELYDCCDVMGHLDPGEQMLVIHIPAVTE